MSPAGMRLTVFDVILTVRSPMHVGSGYVMRRDVDYVPHEESGKIRIVNIDKALALMSDAEAEKAHNGQIAGALDVESRRKCTRVVYPTPSGSANIGEIREFVRDPVTGLPCIPGSTLKGALRSAAIGHVVAKNGRSPIPGGAVENLLDVGESAMAGGDAPRRGTTRSNRDAMRAVRVSDFFVARSTQDRPIPLYLAGVSADSLRPDRAAGIPIWLEALVPGTILKGGITIESGTPIRTGDEKVTYAIAQVLGNCAAQRAARLADYEIDARGEAGAERSELFSTIKRESETPNGPVWLNVGWGGGWHTKTVAPELWQTNRQQWGQIADAARQRYRNSQGERPNPFPSTRRLAKRANERLPMGWLTLEVDYANNRIVSA